MLRVFISYAVVDNDSRRGDRVQELAHDLEGWRTGLPEAIAHPASCPLPHVIVLHLVYHLSIIYLFRPFYRTTNNTGSRVEASRCDAAANSILQLLKLYDLFHSVQKAPGTLINVIFSTTTVFLLKGAEEQDRPEGLSPPVRRNISDLLDLMRDMSMTFWDAGRGLVAVLSLCSDWLPGAFDTEAFSAQLPPLGGTTPPPTNGQSSLPSTATLVDPTTQVTDATTALWLHDTLPGIDDWLADGDFFAGLGGTEM